MAVYDVEKRLRLRELGYDPDTVEEFNPEPTPPPVQQNPSTSPTPEVTKTGAGLRSFARGVIPAGGALAGASAGAALGALGGPAAPVTVPLGGILGSLAGGFGMGMAQNAVVDNVLPENISSAYRESERIDREQQPVASTIGNIAAGLVGLKPSLQALPGAGRAARDLVQRGLGLATSPAHADDLGNLLNVGIGATLPVGARLAQGDATGGELVAELVGGALLNDPNKIGQNVFRLKPNTYRQDPYKNIQQRHKVSEPVPEVNQLLLPERTGAIPMGDAPAAPSTDLNYTQIQELFRQSPPPPAAPEVNPTELLLKTAETKKQVAQQELTTALTRRTLAETEQMNREAARISQEAEAMTAELKSVEEGASPIDDLVNPYKESSSGKLAEISEERVAPIVRGLTSKGIPFRPSEAWKQAGVQRASELGIETQTDRRVYAPGGREIAGRSQVEFSGDKLKKAVAEINPNKATLETQPHEMIHGTRDILVKLGDKRDKTLLDRGDAIVGKSEDYKRWKAARDSEKLDSSVDEYITTLGGEDFVRRQLSTDGKGAFRNWLSDFYSHVKFKFGKASSDDMARIWSGRLANDPPFAQRFGLKAVDAPRTGDLTDSSRAPEVKPDTKLEPEFQFKSEPLFEFTTGAKSSEEGSVRPAAKVTYDKLVDYGVEGIPAFHFYHLDEDIPGHPKGSTVSQRTLEKAGYKVPDGMPQDSAEELSAKVSGFENFKKSRQESEVKPANEVKPPETSQQEEGTIRESSAGSIPKSGGPEVKEAPTANSREVSLPVFRSIVDNVRKIGSPTATTAADSLTKFFDGLTTYRGKLLNRFSNNIRQMTDLDGVISAIVSNPKNYWQQDTPVLKSTLQKMYELRDGGSPTFTAEEAKIRAEVQRMLKQVRDEHRTKTGIKRQPGEDDPNYIPHVVSREVIQTISKNPDSAESIKLRQDFIDYQSKKLAAAGSKDPVKDAEDNYNKLVQGYSKKSVDTASQYGPIDKAEGLGLPSSWRETNLLGGMQRYLERVSRRFAYHDAIESNLQALAALKTLSPNTHVKHAMNYVEGVQPIQEAFLNAAQGVVRSAMLGPLTGARDFTANLTLGLQHAQNPAQHVRGIVDAVKNMSENIADGFETGRIRSHMNDLEWTDTIGALRRVRDVVSDIQGRNWLEQITRATAIGQGKYLTLDFHQQHLNGNLSSAGRKWFADFGKDVDWKKASLSREDLLKIAGRYVDSVQGTYDPRGLPNWALEGQLSPVFALARWNIEKANNFSKFVVTPLVNGNPRPFLMSTLGMIVGGAAVNKLTEEVTGRKEKTPKLKELQTAAESGHDTKMATLYKALGLASASGYAGMMGDLAKNAMDRLYAKQKPRWYNNLLLESVGATSEAVAAFVREGQKDGYTPELAIDFVSSVLEDNVQLYRIVMTRLSEEKLDKLDESNKLRDVRTYKLLAGEDVVEYFGSDYNADIGNDEVKKFKKTTDPEEAAKLLPELINSALEKSNGDAEKLKKELSRLKRNQYLTMPNPDNAPRSFWNYYEFLSKTQGKEEADRRVVDYFTRNEINQAKSAAVP